eukprot:TRINITY_DN6077_c0_g1_i1.p1 TRINITY_DN6077_c0_g1~~TRINITY_DN6077_c0_g1_i1.p1  ORF type:complete len:1047 (-),score=221.38 TRINITY_DN6077_c0_g1_i1:47-3187(-)
MTDLVGENEKCVNWAGDTDSGSVVTRASSTGDLVFPSPIDGQPVLDGQLTLDDDDVDLPEFYENVVVDDSMDDLLKERSVSESPTRSSALTMSSDSAGAKRKLDLERRRSTGLMANALAQPEGSKEEMRKTAFKTRTHSERAFVRVERSNKARSPSISGASNSGGNLLSRHRPSGERPSSDDRGSPEARPVSTSLIEDVVGQELTFNASSLSVSGALMVRSASAGSGSHQQVTPNGTPPLSPPLSPASHERDLGLSPRDHAVSPREAAWSPRSSPPLSPRQKKKLDVALTDENAFEIVMSVLISKREGIKMRARIYKFRKYKNCFSGMDFLLWVRGIFGHTSPISSPTLIGHSPWGDSNLPHHDLSVDSVPQSTELSPSPKGWSKESGSPKLDASESGLAYQLGKRLINAGYLMQLVGKQFASDTDTTYTPNFDESMKTLVGNRDTMFQAIEMILALDQHTPLSASTGSPAPSKAVMRSKKSSKKRQTLAEQQYHQDFQGKDVKLYSYHGVVALKSASMARLIQRLTYEKYPDVAFRDVFLLTYRTFSKPEEVLFGLVQRFVIQPPDDMSPSDQRVFQTRTKRAIQLRVCNVLRAWLEDYFFDFMSPAEMTNYRASAMIHDGEVKQPHGARPIAAVKQPVGARQVGVNCKNSERVTGEKLFVNQNGAVLRAKLKQFLEQDVRPILESAANMMNGLIKKKMEEDTWVRGRAMEFSVLDSKGPKTVLKAEEFESGALSVDDMADQLCLFEQQLFSTVSPIDCMAHVCIKKKEKDPDSIVRITQHFNTFTRWVTTRLVEKVRLQERVQLLSKFIALARALRQRNNYQGLWEVYCGMTSTPVKRLTNTWNELSEEENEELESIKTLLNFEGNYQKYRNNLAEIQSSNPCIPYIGLYLKDLVFIQDGNPDYDDKLVNFSKKQRTAEVIYAIESWQSNAYSYEPRADVFRFFLGLQTEVMDDAAAYAMSLDVEPRNTLESFENLMLEAEKMKEELNDLKGRNSELLMRERELENEVAKLNSSNLQYRQQLKIAGHEMTPPSKGKLRSSTFLF